MENWKRIHPDAHTPLRGTLYSLDPSPRARPPTRAARGQRAVVSATRRRDPEPDREESETRTGTHGRSMDAQTRREWRDPTQPRERRAAGRARCRAHTPQCAPQARPTEAHSSAGHSAAQHSAAHLDLTLVHTPRPGPEGAGAARAERRERRDSREKLLQNTRRTAQNPEMQNSRKPERCAGRCARCRWPLPPPVPRRIVFHVTIAII